MLNCLETISIDNKHLCAKGVQKLLHYDYSKYQIKSIGLSSSKLTIEAAGHLADNISSRSKVYREITSK